MLLLRNYYVGRVFEIASRSRRSPALVSSNFRSFLCSQFKARSHRLHRHLLAEPCFDLVASWTHNSIDIANKLQPTFINLAFGSRPLQAIRLLRQEWVVSAHSCRVLPDVLGLDLDKLSVLELLIAEYVFGNRWDDVSSAALCLNSVNQTFRLLFSWSLAKRFGSDLA